MAEHSERTLADTRPLPHNSFHVGASHWGSEDSDRVTALAYIVTGEKDRANFRTGQM